MNPSPQYFWKSVAAIFAGGLALAGGLWFHTHYLLPLWRKEATALADAKVLRASIEEARQQIAEVMTLERAAKEPRRTLHRMQSENPAGSPAQWMPNLLNARFGRPESGPLPTRLHSVEEAPNIEGHQRGFWSTSFPLGTGNRKIADLLESIVELEQQHPSVRLVNLVTQPNAGSGGVVTASIDLAVLIPR